MLLLVDNSDFDHPVRSTFCHVVPDLDATHQQALAAGADETVPITEAEGMPRTSAVTDPDGNWIWLYQADALAIRHYDQHHKNPGSPGRDGCRRFGCQALMLEA